MKAAKEHKQQQSRVIKNAKNNSVVQMGRVGKIVGGSNEKRKIVFKINFAGSGYRRFPSKYYVKGQEVNKVLYYYSGSRKSILHKIELPGPQKMLGIQDGGKHSIHRNLNYVKDCILYSVKPNDNKEVHVIIKGHSRGGVAASCFANWMKRYIPNANVELTLLDPVPGPSHSGEYVDITSNADLSTVIYSLTADRDLVHKIGFTPQIVRGANRIILTKEGHDCGTGIRDNSQKKVKYFFCGKYYSLSQLNSLPNGCYYAEKEYDETGQIRIRLWLIPKGSALADIKKLSKIHGRKSAIKTSILNMYPL